MNLENLSPDHLLRFIKSDLLRFFAKYLILFTVLFISLGLMSLLAFIATESNPFFYANF